MDEIIEALERAELVISEQQEQIEMLAEALNKIADTDPVRMMDEAFGTAFFALDSVGMYKGK